MPYEDSDEPLPDTKPFKSDTDPRFAVERMMRDLENDINQNWGCILITFVIISILGYLLLGR
jgi:hypothetical protein